MKTNKPIFGFTLIEMIVVIGVIGLALPILFTIILAILQQQTRIYALQEIKRQGDTIITSINNTIRNNAVAIYSDENFTTQAQECADAGESYSATNPQTDFFLKDKLVSARFNYYLDALDAQHNTLASASSITTPPVTNLSNDKVTVTNFAISCICRGKYSSPIISYSFTVSYSTIASLNYKSKVKLRSY